MILPFTVAVTELPPKGPRSPSSITGVSLSAVRIVRTTSAFGTFASPAVTFPVKVYSMVRFSVTPEVNAASTILIVMTVILTAVALRLQGDPAAAAGHTGDKA